LLLVVLVTHFKGIECFNLGRNVSGLDQDDRLVKSNIFEGPMFRQVVEQNGFSNEILGSPIANFLASTQKSPPSSANAEQSATVDNNGKSAIASIITNSRPFVENLDDISFEVRAAQGVPVEQVRGGQLVSTSQPTVHHFKEQHSNERDDDEEDSSNEIRSNINNNSRRSPIKDSSIERSIHLDSTDFHKRPSSGMLIQPESEDWFLVRQYMDDESFRGSSRELAKEYFWQPVKGSSKGLDSESEEDDSNESS
jgi:hypothetical protein